jgi:hypothetical protein
MAKDKKSFILYCDQWELFELLPMGKRGELISIIFSYVNDENPIVEDPLLKMAFTSIRRALKLDLQKWEQQHQRRVQAGSKGGKARANKAKQDQAMLSNAKQTQANQAVSVNGSVSVSVNDTVNVNDIKKEREKNFREQVAQHPYSKELIDNFCDYWTESKPKGRKLRFELEKVFDIARRLNTWEKRQKDFKPSSEQSQEHYDEILKTLRGDEN